MYIIRRISQAVVTLFAVLTVGFGLGRLAGPPGALILPAGATATEVDAYNAALGFDRPLIVQYLDFLAGAVTGDLGDSYRQNAPALELVVERLPATLYLALTSFALALSLAVAVALLAQVSRSRILRQVLVWVGAVRLSIPDFLFAVLMVLTFSVTFRLLPSLGYQGFQSYVLPVVTLASAQFFVYVRLLGASLGEEESRDYVRTAVAKGQSRATIVARQMLPNAFLPVLTVAGLNLGALIGGTLIVENVFTWPGLGQLMLLAVTGRDYPVVLATMAVTAALFVITNLAVDVIAARIDPRVRLS